MKWIYWLSTLLGLAMISLVVGLAQASAPDQSGGASTKSGVQTAAVVPAVQEGFELGSLVFTQFTQAIPTCVPGGCGWQVVTTDHHTGTYSVHAPDVNNVSDQQILLNSPAAIPPDATSASLTFWQRYDFG